MYYHGRTDLPPFVSIKAFYADAGIGSLLQSAKHISTLRLEGLEINIPPKSERQPMPKNGQAHDGGKAIDIVVDRIVADGTTLRILPKQEGKDPLQWDIHKLTLHSVGVGRPMQFAAILGKCQAPRRDPEHRRIWSV